MLDARLPAAKARLPTRTVNRADIGGSQKPLKNGLKQLFFVIFTIFCFKSYV
jgi:hypothetical protein